VSGKRTRVISGVNLLSVEVIMSRYENTLKVHWIAVVMFATLPKGARTTIIVSKTTFLGAALVGSLVTGQCSAFQAVQHLWGGKHAARWGLRGAAQWSYNPRGGSLSHNADEGAAPYPVRPSPCI
jgi:hypothetical protein